MTDSVCSNNRIRLAVAVTERRRAFYAQLLAECPSLEVVSAMIPASGLARDWKKAFGCHSTSTEIEEILGDSAVDAFLLVDRDCIDAAAIETVLRAGKHALIASPAAYSLDQFDRLVETAAGARAGLMVLMPWRFDDSLLRAKLMHDDGVFGPNPQATFWATINPRTGEDPLERFIRAALPEFEIANWLFGVAQTVSADLDSSFGRASAIIATHPGATVVHHYCAGLQSASMRIQGNQSEFKIDSPNAEWDNFVECSSGSMKRTGREAPNPSTTGKLGKQNLMVAAMNAVSRSLVDPTECTKNHVAGRQALEAVLASVVASRDGTRVSLPLTYNSTATLTSRPEKRSLLPSALPV